MKTPLLLLFTIILISALLRSQERQQQIGAVRIEISDTFGHPLGRVRGELTNIGTKEKQTALGNAGVVEFTFSGVQLRSTSTRLCAC